MKITIKRKNSSPYYIILYSFISGMFLFSAIKFISTKGMLGWFLLSFSLSILYFIWAIRLLHRALSNEKNDGFWEGFEIRERAKNAKIMKEE